MPLAAVGKTHHHMEELDLAYSSSPALAWSSRAFTGFGQPVSHQRPRLYVNFLDCFESIVAESKHNVILVPCVCLVLQISTALGLMACVEMFLAWLSSAAVSHSVCMKPSMTFLVHKTLKTLRPCRGNNRSLSQQILPRLSTFRKNSKWFS